MFVLFNFKRYVFWIINLGIPNKSITTHAKAYLISYKDYLLQILDAKMNHIENKASLHFNAVQVNLT